MNSASARAGRLPARSSRAPLPGVGAPGSDAASAAERPPSASGSPGAQSDGAAAPRSGESVATAGLEAPGPEASGKASAQAGQATFAPATVSPAGGGSASGGGSAAAEQPTTGPDAGAAGEQPGGGARAGAGAGGDVPQPRHAPDPYGTPPYGEPGPWAPAPPVQRPVATPAHGTPVPPAVAQSAPGQAATPAHGTHMPPAPVGGPPPHHPTPAHGTRLPAHSQMPAPTPTPAHGTPLPASATSGQWRQYDPWSASPTGAAGPIGAAGAATPPGVLEPPPRRRPRRGSMLLGALLLALVSGGIGGGIGAYVERNGGITEVELPQASAEPGDRARDPESVAGIAAAALPGVVTLHVEGSDGQATGTGFVLDKRGHILTNSHVVEPAASSGDISVTFSGGEVARAEIVGRDTGYDLAVVKVSGVSGLRPLTLGNSDSVRVGDPVVAIGSPYDLAGTVTSGIISAKERPITAGGEQADGSDISYVDALQTDAPINPGNSGGPLVDSEGRVIGINSAIKAADSGSGGLDSAQGGSIGLGFAIPVNQGKRVAEELINTGRATHPVIGVTLDLEYTGDGARVRTGRSGVGSGAPVKPGGPGDKAGIEAGDVITEVDGARVHSGEELIVKIRSHRPGDRLELTLERDGKERTLKLTLGSASGG
ncbi:trypsin-like peptidase domain-containing protein [Streptomyces sp. 8N616]|uniref:trypsin-like peptidase domain-containing protein n=1 Tax=Streptomyces sp. 8N616 TaxID=3457414 RepID=UPI003FCF5AC0